MIVPLTGTIRKYKFVLTPKARETTLLFTHTCPVTEFAVASHLNTANSCCHHVFLRHFRFQKCLPVNSNKTTPPIRAVPSFSSPSYKNSIPHIHTKIIQFQEEPSHSSPHATPFNIHSYASYAVRREISAVSSSAFSADKTPHPVNTLLY